MSAWLSVGSHRPPARAAAQLRPVKSNIPRAPCAPLVPLLAGAVALGLVILPVFLIPTVRVCPDLIQFWTAAQLIASAHSPYDPVLQASIQQQIGWQTATYGPEVYPFLPYYYPPWLALIYVPLLALGYAKAKFAWLVINAGLLLAAGLLFRNVARSLSATAVVLLVCLFAPCVLTVLMGQVSILVLLAAIGAWRLLEKGQDVAAGAVLGWLTIKPQLTAVLLLGLLIWCARRGRWRVVNGFVAALTLLVLSSTLLSPSWPIDMATAMQVSRVRTELAPTALTVLQTVGARGTMLWACYLAIASTVIALVLHAAWNRTSGLEAVVGVSLIAPFFVAPYARHYDFAILLIPALILIAECKGTRSAWIWMGGLLVLPYLWLAIPGRSRFMFFWLPLLIAVAWLRPDRPRFLRK